MAHDNDDDDDDDIDDDASLLYDRQLSDYGLWRWMVNGVSSFHVSHHTTFSADLLDLCCKFECSKFEK
jgi:hypothetical protein